MPLLYRKQGHTGILTLSRPQARNCWGQDIPNSADASLADAYRFMVLEMSEDKAEAHQAWRARRKPSFRGR